MTGIIINIPMLHFSEFISVAGVVHWFVKDILWGVVVYGFFRFELGKKLYPNAEKKLGLAKASFFHEKHRHQAKNIYACDKDRCALIN